MPSNEGQAAPTIVSTPVHLVVLQHGLWGNAANLDTVESLLLQHVAACSSHQSDGQQGPTVRTLNSAVNSEKLTYDGIHTCGQRLVQLIRDTVDTLLQKEGLQVTHISFIGYSLGGLIARYAVGVLQHEGAFDGCDGLVPVNFVTISTPHLGAWRLDEEQASWGYRLFNRMYHSMVPVIASMTGHQLMLKDAHAWDRPLLMLMSDPTLPFYQGLERFKTLTLLANTHNDRMVPYRTAAIRRTDPYVGRHTTPTQDPKQYPSVVRPCDDAEEVQRAVQGKWVLVAFCTLLPVLLPVMLVVLAKMTWEGRQHYAGVLREGMTHTWLLKASPGNKSRNLAEPADVEMGSESGSGDGSTAGVEAESVVLQAKAGVQPGPAAITASSTLEKQEWIIDHLNKLPWFKVDVDVRHGHAHAAIVLRNPKRFTAKDHLEFLFSRMQW